MSEDTSGIVASILLAICVGCFALIGVRHSFRDYRHFDTIVKECKQHGRMQDQTTRIICSVEER